MSNMSDLDIPVQNPTIVVHELEAPSDSERNRPCVVGIDASNVAVGDNITQIPVGTPFQHKKVLQIALCPTVRNLDMRKGPDVLWQKLVLPDKLNDRVTLNEGERSPVINLPPKRCK
jgi:hypothetical protein